MKLSIHLVTWNGAKYISPLFDSIKKSQLLDVNCQMFILDNGSSDNTVELIKKELVNFSPSCRFIELKENTGFANGHNRLWKESAADYILLINQDLVFESDAIQKMVDWMDVHPEAAAVAPRLMQFSLSDVNCQMSNVIDSLGLRVFRSRRVVDDGQGEMWNDQTGAREVFGVSGACALFRRGALLSVRDSDGNLFDPDFGSYKEDVDLACRMRIAGLRSFVLLDAVAYHDRTASGAKKRTMIPLRTRMQSYRNHLMMLFKNEYGRNFLLDFPWILWYEGSKFFYALFFDRAVLAGLRDLWSARHALVKKRLEIKQQRRVDAATVRHFFV